MSKDCLHTCNSARARRKILVVVMMLLLFLCVITHKHVLPHQSIWRKAKYERANAHVLLFQHVVVREKEVKKNTLKSFVFHRHEKEKRMRTLLFRKLRWNSAVLPTHHSLARRCCFDVFVAFKLILTSRRIFSASSLFLFFLSPVSIVFFDVIKKTSLWKTSPSNLENTRRIDEIICIK